MGRGPRDRRPAECLGGPSGSAPITISNHSSEAIFARRYVEAGIRSGATRDGAGTRIGSNHFDLAMIMDYWSEQRLNHHTEATSTLYAVRKCLRVALGEGLDARYARHAAAGRAMSAGLRAMSLRLFGDDATRMANVTALHIPDGIDGERVRAAMREPFEIEIGTAFGPLAGKVWRIGVMSHNAMRQKVMLTFGASETCLRRGGFAAPAGAAADAAIAAWTGDAA